MKCFVIKNKEGKYYHFNNYYGELEEALFYSKEDVDEIHLQNGNTWQEVTLVEGDLEKELAVRDKALDIIAKALNQLNEMESGRKYIGARKIKNNAIDQARKELEV